MIGGACELTSQTHLRPHRNGIYIVLESVTHMSTVNLAECYFAQLNFTSFHCSGRNSSASSPQRSFRRCKAVILKKTSLPACTRIGDLPSGPPPTGNTVSRLRLESPLQLMGVAALLGKYHLRICCDSVHTNLL